MTAIRKHLKEFVALIALAVVAGTVAFYILSNERFRFPWEPAPLHLNAALSTAQAVTPGQGQTVLVSGVKVGEIPITRPSSTPTPARCCVRRPA